MNIKLKVLSTAVIFFSGQALFAQKGKVDTAKVSNIEEVVIVGYGTQKRTKVIGAIDQVNSDAIKGRANVTATQALQGKSANLIIQQRNNEPGAGLNINIRGVSTLGSNSPLVVIDGIIGGDINSLNPADIESVSVLKDAGSAAIYGSRSANGVLLITTKTGKKNRPMSVNFNALLGYNIPHFFTKPVHGYENAMLRNEAALNSGVAMPYTAAQIRQFKENGDTQWFAKEITKPAMQSSYNVSASGGNQNNTYMVSVGYMNQESNLVGPWKGMERYNFRTNLTSEFGKFKVTSNFAYSKQMIVDHAGSTGTLFADAFRVPLYYKQKDSNGNYLTNDVLQEFNPLGILEKGGFRRYDNDDISGNITAEYKIADWLKLKGVFGGRIWENDLYARTLQVNFFPGGVAGANRDTRDETFKSLDLNSQLLLEFNKTYGRHSINALVGASTESYRGRGFRLKRIFTDPDLGTPSTGYKTDEGGSSNSNQNAPKNAINSLFGRVSYDFENKYFAEFSARYDGSSKFRKELRWGFFPSATLGYRITQEDFMQGYADKVGNIKLRGSYGILGNQNVGNFQYQTTYFSFQNAYAWNNVAVSGTGYNFANADITWERAATFNVGFDADFFKGALSISADYFNKVTRRILLRPQVPGVYGTGLPDFNAGEVGNQGWELSATWRHRGQLFRHTLTANIGDSKNKVLNFNNGQERLQGIEELQLLIREGLPINSYVGYKRDGIFRNYEEIKGAAVPVGLTVQPGDNRYVDVNKDGVIDEKDLMIFGNSFPRYTFGLTYNIEYKGFDMSVFVQGVGKRTMMIRGELVEPFHSNYGMTMYTNQLDYWTPANPDAKYPRLSNSGSMSNANNYRRGSDMYLFDGAYARLKNVQIGYTLSKELLHDLGLQNLRIYASGQNLYTWSKIKFVDPEISEFDSNMGAGGANSGRAYPTPIYYGLGLDVTF